MATVVTHEDLRSGRLNIYKLTGCEADDLVAEFDRLRAENKRLREERFRFKVWIDGKEDFLGEDAVNELLLCDEAELTRLRAEVFAWQKQFADVNELKEILRSENQELRRLMDLPDHDSDSEGRAGSTPMHEAWKTQPHRRAGVATKGTSQPK